jgi:hypothetical protein
MSDMKKLGKQVDRAKELVEARRAELDAAIVLHADAVASHAVALDKLEEAEALEAARELRGKR